MTTRPAATRRSHIDRTANQMADALAASATDESLSTVQAATFIGCSPSFLEIGRCKGYGPRFRRLSPRMIKYLKSDVIDWLRSRARHQSTAEYAD
jgi:hypothetical protein